MTIKNKSKMIAALSLFQVVASVATASDIKTVFIAQDNATKVTCDVAQLDRAKTLNDWPGTVMDNKINPNSSNTVILRKINDQFAGGNYFDSYPHKLPNLFKEGACVTDRKARR